MIVTRTPSYTLQKKNAQTNANKGKETNEKFLHSLSSHQLTESQLSQLVIYILTTSELLTGSNLQGTPQRYRAVLVNNQCYLTEAMRQFSIARNTLRDYLSICELQIIDAEKYKGVVKAEREKIAKVS